MSSLTHDAYPSTKKHSSTNTAEFGLFLRLPWLPYVIGFMATVIILVIFLFFYFHIIRKKKEIIRDEEKSFISSRRSSGKEATGIFSLIGITQSSVNTAPCHPSLTNNANNVQSIIGTDNNLLALPDTYHTYQHPGTSTTPLAIPRRARAHSNHSNSPHCHSSITTANSLSEFSSLDNENHMRYSDFRDFSRRHHHTPPSHHPLSTRTLSRQYLFPCTIEETTSTTSP